MNVLNKKDFYTYPEFMSDDRMPIVGTVWCDDDNNLPTVTEFTGYRLITGSRALTPNKTYVLSGSTWVEKEESPFKDVYTKSEVDALVNPIDTALTALTTRVDSLAVYTYKLIGISSLNKLDSSVWSGQTPAGAGYIANNLPIVLPAGTYIWKMKRDGNTSTSFVIKDANEQELYRVNRGAGVNDITQSFTINSAAAFVSIYVGYNISYSDNMIFEYEAP